MANKYLQNDLSVIENHLKLSGLTNNILLVTGATGLIGSLIIKGVLTHNKNNPKNIIKLIAFCKNKDKAIDIYKEYIDLNNLPNGVNFYYQDITAPISEKIKCDYIIHTASPTTSAYFISNPVETLLSITEGTKNLLNYAKAVNVKGFVNLSSMEVYGSVNTTKRLLEKELGFLDLSNPRSCYPVGKRWAECLVSLYAKEYNLNAKTARLSQTFGAGVLPSDNRVYADFCKKAVKGENLVLRTNGKSFGNYCYTTDAINAILTILTKGEKGETYNVVNEEMTMQIKTLAKFIASNFSNGKSKVVFDIPKSNIFGYAPYTKLHLSATKLNSLGWKPTVNLTQAFTKITNYLKYIKALN